MARSKHRDRNRDLRKDEDRRRRFIVVFFGALIFIAGASIVDVELRKVFERRQMSSSAQQAGKTGARRPPLTIDSQVEKFKRQTGDRMNLERIRVQYENMQRADPSSLSSGENPRDPFLTGVPLQTEPHPFALQPDGSMESSSTFPDANVMNTVQEERDLEIWEKRARDEYVGAFVENARQMGYKVNVLSNYDVEYAPLGPAEARRPQGSANPSGGGSAK